MGRGYRGYPLGHRGPFGQCGPRGLCGPRNRGYYGRSCGGCGNCRSCRYYQFVEYQRTCYSYGGYDDCYSYDPCGPCDPCGPYVGYRGLPYRRWPPCGYYWTSTDKVMSLQFGCAFVHSNRIELQAIHRLIMAAMVEHKITSSQTTMAKTIAQPRWSIWYHQMTSMTTSLPFGDFTLLHFQIVWIRDRGLRYNCFCLR